MITTTRLLKLGRAALLGTGGNSVGIQRSACDPMKLLISVEVPESILADIAAEHGKGSTRHMYDGKTWQSLSVDTDEGGVIYYTPHVQMLPAVKEEKAS